MSKIIILDKFTIEFVSKDDFIIRNNEIVKDKYIHEVLSYSFKTVDILRNSLNIKLKRYFLEKFCGKYVIEGKAFDEILELILPLWDVNSYLFVYEENN